MIKPKGYIYFVTKKIELVPTTAEQSAEYAVPRLLHHPVDDNTFQMSCQI